MTTIAIDGLSEEEFRRSIESGLRRGRASESVAKLRALIEPFAGEGRILPGRFLTVDSADLVLGGWEELDQRIRRYDRPGRLVTAISIAFGWPGEDLPQPDADGWVSPLIEVGYYNDDAYPFSRSGREDLLDGYSIHGCTWADDFVGSDNVLTLEGISDLHGALAALEAHLLDSEEPDPDAICAGSLGACLLSALLYQAVTDKVAAAGLPRALCVMAGSNGVYPYFDAPVTGMPLDVLKAARADDEEDNPFDTGVPGPRYSSLALTGIKRAPKRAVLVLEESEEEMAVRIANLRGLAQGHPDAAIAAPAEMPQAEAEAPSAEGIIDSPISPLMTKKPHGQGWDFRDMLGPRDPEGPGDADHGLSPAGDWDDEDWLEPEADLAGPDGPHDAGHSLDRDEPELAAEVEPAEALDVPLVSNEPAIVPEPGFALVEGELQNDLQARLQSLLASSLMPAAIEPEPEVPNEAQTEPEAPGALLVDVAAPAVPEVTVPHWPLGLGWFETDEPAAPPALTFAEAETESPEAERRPGLLARLRNWIGALRPAPPPQRSRRPRS